MVVIVAGFVLIGGSAVGGIAFAANRSSDSPATHPHTTSSPGDQGKGNEDNNKQDSDHASANPSSTCAMDNDADDTATTGEHNGMPTASRSPEGDEVHHTGVTPTAAGSHHPEPTEAAEAPETKDAHNTGTSSSCERDDD
jgi:hypothetical protein